MSRSTEPVESEKSNESEATFSAFETPDDISDIRVIDIPVLVIFWGLLIIVMLQFFTRYVLNDSWSWTEEIARYFLIFLGFVGSVTCVRKGSHIFLEFFYRYLPARAIKPISISVEILNTGFFAFLGYFAVELVERTYAQKMVSVDLPKSVIYWVVVVSCFAMAITSAYNVFRLFRERPEEVVQEKLDQAISG